MASPSAVNSLIKFRNEYKPDKCIHAGDFIDTSAWRAGARGGADEVANVADDVNAGLVLLERLQPDLVFNGNHEIRIWNHARKPNAIVAQAAVQTMNQLRDFIAGDLKSEYVEDYVLDKSWRRLGNFLVGHGFFHSTNAVKKHADVMGNCMFVHLHRLEVARASRSDGPVAVCAGFLGDKDKFGYSDLWESRFRWGNGWVWGEYCDDLCLWQMHHHLDKQSLPKQFKSV